MPEPFNPDAAARGDGIYGLPFTPETAEAVLIPVPWEATVSYGAGTAGGPAAILEASRQVDLFDRETGRPYERGIAMLPLPAKVARLNAEAREAAATVIAGGGVEHDPSLEPEAARVNALGEELNAWVEAEASGWMDRGKLVAVVGGDHSVPFGSIRAAARRHPGVGVLHLDAHADLRRAYEGFTWSHASIMANVYDRIPEVSRIVQVGIRDLAGQEDALIRKGAERLRTRFESDVRSRLQDGEPWSRIAVEIIEDLPEKVYLSFDIDGLDPALCPHTGTPVPGGLSFAEATSLLRTVVQSGREIVGLDLCEVAPDPAGGNGWDGNVGARLLYKMLGFAFLSRPRR